MDPVGDPEGLAGVADVLDQHRELVPPQPCDRVPGAEARLEPPREGDEHLVPGHVPEAVVDHLELVEVDVEDRERIVVAPPAAGEGLAQAVAEQRAVGEAGQRVVERVVEEPFLRLLAAGDVGQGAGHAVGLAPRVPHREAAAEHPAIGAVAMPDAVLHLEVRLLALEVHVQALAKLSDLFRMDAAQPLVGGRAQLGGGMAEHLLPARREVDPVVPKVPVEEPVVGAAHGQRVALLALLQRQQGGLLLRFHPLALTRGPDGGLQAGDPFLQHVVRGAGLDDVGGGLFVERPGHDDERRPGSHLSGELQGGQAVVARQVVVGQDQVERKSPQRPFVVLAADDPGERELPDVLPQLPLEELLVGRIVLQHEDGERVINHGTPRALSPQKVYHFRLNSGRLRHDISQMCDTDHISADQRP